MGDIMDVGFIGLGNMGAEMARNLLKAGHRVTVYNRTRAKAQALAAKGAQMAERVADACRGEILITVSPMMPRSKPWCSAKAAPGNLFLPERSMSP
jgi:3-hydroxyisobutyrate dehydrogenase-like beta-hydroxyacid dehydrogenase